MLPLLVLAYWSLREPELPIFTAALMLGIALDTVFDTPFGANAVTMVPGLYFIHRFNALVTAMPLWQTTLMLIPGLVAGRRAAESRSTISRRPVQVPRSD